MKSKKHKKHGKSKKSKKSKRKSSSSSGSSSEAEEMEWVEASAPASSSVAKETATAKRDDWMQDECFVPTYSKDETQTKKKKKLVRSEEEIRKEKKVLEERELNPYWKNDGVGLPTSSTPVQQVQTSSVGDGGYGFLLKAYQRVVERSKEEGKSIEEVAAERWGSLGKLISMLEKAEKQVNQNRPSANISVQEKPDSDFSGGKHKSSSYGHERHSSSASERRDTSQTSKTDHYSSDDSEEKQSHRFRHHKQSSSREKSKLNYHSSRHHHHHSSSRSHQFKDDRHRSSRSRSPKSRSIEKHSDRHDRDDNNREAQRSIPEDSSRVYAWNRGGHDKQPSRRDSFVKPEDNSSDRSSKLGNNSKSSYQPSWKKKSSSRYPSFEDKFTSPNDDDDYMKSKSQEHHIHESSASSSGVKGSFQHSEKNFSNVVIDSESDESTESQPREDPVLNNNELNYLAARLLRAELWNDTELASRIEKGLELAKKQQEEFIKCGGKISHGHPRDEVLRQVVDRYPLPRGLSTGRKKKGSEKTVFIGQPRTKHFDDEKMTLQHIFEREKSTSVDDHLKMFVDAASSRKGIMDEECDEDASGKTAEKMNKFPKQERDIQKAIKDYKHLNFALDRCRFCLDKPGLLKHTIVEKGNEVFLCCPPFVSLTEGHCFIVPVTHVSSTLLLDENEYAEIQAFKRGLMKMFGDQGKGMIFMETSVKQQFYPHAFIECIPMPKETWDMAPLYFKKAIDESEYEWSHNKKLIDLSKKGVRNSVPKGLPFFSVEFGNNGGFAHVIEDDKCFPKNFGREIVGGMLEMDSYEIKERPESTDGICKKVLKIVDMWWKYEEYFRT